jgi:hypothetical protein
MKVYVLPADAYACGHYRLAWPADCLRQQGVVDVEIMPPQKDSGFLARTRENPDGSQTLTSIQIPTDADVVVLQRPAHPLQPQMINIMRRNGVAVVVDMDDDMSAIHPRNVAFETYRNRPGNRFSWKHAAESCRLATLVTTSTRALQRIYARHGRGVVIDNYIPEVLLATSKQETGFFGWAGSTAGHPDDAQVTVPAPQRLLDEGYRFKVISSQSKVKECMRLREEPAYTGSFRITDWIQGIADNCDVGMVPLSKTAFNASKSRLKGIEYMAAGVAWVASPREEYRKLHRESGCGLLADTPKEWYAQLKRLLDDDVLRKEQVEMGREYMVGQTMQANAWRWAEAWTKAMEIQRS